MDSSKILYFITEDWFFCSHFLARAVAARDAGFDVVVVARENSLGGKIRDHGIKFVPFPISRRSVNPFRELMTVFRLISIYRRERPALVHHIALKPIMYGSIAAMFSGRPKIVNAPIGLGFVFSSSSWKAMILRPLSRLGLKVLLNPRGSRVVFENSDDLGSFVAFGMVRARDAVLIRGAGVDTEIFSFVPEPEGVPVVILTARMLWDKGVGEYVEAARLLRSRGCQARFLLAGNPDEENPAAISVQILKGWQDEGVIEWLGHREDIPMLLAQSHIVCLPSYREGLPKSLLEGLATGRPIVATDVPGCREAVRHGVNGYLVPVKDPVALADALEKLIIDKKLRREMGAASRDLAVTEFISARIEAETLEVYFQLTNTLRNTQAAIS
ncbi:MAG: glycosyltransferase family 4 protein [Desulfomicrobium sp.]|nr:glycosyltransferase family 4 protein [Desulfomicrobium sp.]